LYTEYLKLGEAEKTEFTSSFSGDALAQFNTLGAKADDVHRRNAHKEDFPVNLNVL